MDKAYCAIETQQKHPIESENNEKTTLRHIHSNSTINRQTKVINVLWGTMRLSVRVLFIVGNTFYKLAQMVAGNVMSRDGVHFQCTNIVVVIFILLCLCHSEY